MRLRFGYDRHAGATAGSDDRRIGLTSGQPAVTITCGGRTDDLTGGSAVRSRVITTSVALAAVGAMALASCSSSKGNSSNNKTGGLGGGGQSGGSTAGQTYTLGFIGALSGANAQLGIN